jgi:hypothetical protein
VRKPTFVFTATALAPVVRPTQVNLADQLALVGYERKTDKLTPGGTFTAHLYWTALQPMPESYTGFMHLVGPDGKMAAQDDHELGRGFYRTLFWQPGEIVRERYELTLPAHLPPGEYTVQAGAYRFPSLARLAVRSSDVAAQDNVLTVDVMQVGR